MAEFDLWLELILQWEEARSLSSWRIAKLVRGCIVGWLRCIIDHYLQVRFISKVKEARKIEVVAWSLERFVLSFSASEVESLLSKFPN